MLPRDTWLAVWVLASSACFVARDGLGQTFSVEDPARPAEPAEDRSRWQLKRLPDGSDCEDVRDAIP
jgi:hypothetical protein